MPVTEIEDVFALDVRVITDIGPEDTTRGCDTNDGCETTCASSCASNNS